MNKKSLYLALPAFALACGLPSVASAYPHITNGNFDAPGKPLDGWNFDARGGKFETPDGVTGKCVWLNHDGAVNHDPAVSQKMVKLTVGKEYVVSGKYKGGKTVNLYAKPGHPMLALDIDGESVVKVVAATTADNKINTTDWLTFSVNFKAKKDSMLLAIRGEIDGKDADVYIDSVDVKEVPPIIVNGSFDDDKKTAYSKWTIEVVEPAVANQRDSQGNGFIWLNHAGRPESDPSISQQMNNLVVGTKYLISGRYKVGKTADLYGGKPGDNLIAVDVDGVNISKTAPAPSVEGHSNQLDKQHWLSFSATFEAKKTSQMLKFRGEIDGKDADVYIDDVSVSKDSN